MYEVVWGGYQTQPWRNGIISTPHVTLSPQIWGRLGQCNCIRGHPYSLETAYKFLKPVVYYVKYGCLKQTEVDNSLNYDVMASFSFLKWPLLPKYGANLAEVMVYGCTHMPLRQHTNGSNTFYMPNMDVWSGLRGILAWTMMLWHHFHSTSEPESQNLGPTWPG